MKQTSVELLFNKLWKEPKDKFVWFAILKQYKEMHKQEIMDAFNNGVNHSVDYFIQSNVDYFIQSGDTIEATEYYKQTFNQ